MHVCMDFESIMFRIKFFNIIGNRKILLPPLRLYSFSTKSKFLKFIILYQENIIGKEVACEFFLEFLNYRDIDKKFFY